MLVESENIVKDPILSVIVLTYNQEQFIEECLDSIINQQVSFQYELIIAEDCGIDNTRKICCEYQSKYPNIIRLILQEKNKGISGNYYDALTLSRGKYIAQMGADDYWTDPLKLQKQVEYMEVHPEAGLCYTDYQVLNEANQSLSSAVFANGFHRSANFADHLLTSGYIAPNTWMFSRKLAMFYKDSGYVDESFVLALDAFAKSQVAYLPDVTAIYRVHPDSASNQTNPKKKWKYLYGVFQIQLQYAEKYDKTLLPKVKLRRYLDLLPLAVKCEEKEFIFEATAYLEEQGVDVKGYIQSIKNNILCKEDLRNIKKSYAYRVGKIVMRPLSILRTIIYK